MNEQQIRSALTYEDLADYLTAEHGYDFAIWDDGMTNIIEHSITWGKLDNAPSLRVQCPGIGNLDSEFFTEGFVSYDEELGAYTELKTGRVVGDLSDVIRECCREGDVERFMEDLVSALLEQERSW